MSLLLEDKGNTVCVVSRSWTKLWIRRGRFEDIIKNVEFWLHHVRLYYC